MDVLLLTLDDGVYAVRKDQVVDVRPCPPLFRPPLTPHEMAGVVSLDDKTCVVADLSVSLGGVAVARRQDLTLLVVDRESELPGFVLADAPRSLTLPDGAEHALPEALVSELCRDWVMHEGHFAPLLDLTALQGRLMRGESRFTAPVSLQGALHEHEDNGAQWRVSVHGKPFALCAKNLYLVSGEPVLSPLFSLPDFIPALLLEHNQVYPCCDLAALLLDRPLSSRNICLADFGQEKMAFWIDEGTAPEPLSGSRQPLSSLVVRQGLAQAVVSDGHIYPLLDVPQLCRAGHSWYQGEADSSAAVPLGVDQSESVVEVTINACRYALPRSVVGRELPVMEITPLPAAQAIICGLSLFEGELLPVLDFTPYFGRRAEITPRSRFLLLEDPHFKGLLLVDDVLQGRQLLQDAHRQLPFQLQETLVCGCYVEDKDVVLVLDPLAMAFSFREDVVRDFRKHLVSTGLVGSVADAAQGDWWEILEEVSPEPLDNEIPEQGDGATETQAVAETAAGQPVEEPDVVEEVASEELEERETDLADSAALAAEGEPEAVVPEPASDVEVAPPYNDSPIEPGFDDALGDIAPELVSEDALDETEQIDDSHEALPPAYPESSAAGDSLNKDQASSESPSTVDGIGMGGADASVGTAAPYDTPADVTVSNDEDAAQLSAPDTDEALSSPVGDVDADADALSQVEPTEVVEAAGLLDAEPSHAAEVPPLEEPSSTTVPEQESPIADGVEPSPESLEDQDDVAVSDAPPLEQPLPASADDFFAEAFSPSEPEAESRPERSPDSLEPERVQESCPEESREGNVKCNLWSHAGGREAGDISPHSGHDQRASQRVSSTNKRRLGLLVVLLLLVGGWWLLPFGARSPVTTETVPEVSESQAVVEVPVETAVAPPAATRGVAAEPRVPEMAGGASAGGADKESITIVIPAELLKASLRQEDLVIVIRWGDTLWEIAERYTGDPWNYRRIAQENNIRDPNLIFPRQKLNIRSEE